MIVAIIIGLALAVVIALWWEQGKPDVRAPDDFSEVGVGGFYVGAQSTIAIGSGAKGAYIPPPPPPPPPFVHTLNSAVACGWLIAFVESANNAGILKLESVSQALGRPNTSPYDYAAQAIKTAGTAASKVVIPALSTGALAAGTLVAGPIVVVAGFMSTLIGLDTEIKRKIGEAEACLLFCTEFINAYSLPPMGLLNMLSNLVPNSGQYGMLRGGGTATDRSKEPGVGIVADMVKLYDELLNRGWLKGMVALTNVKLLRELAAKGDVQIALNNNGGSLRPSRLAYWPQYVFSVDYLFLQPRIPQWKRGLADIQYREAAKGAFERSGNPASFDLRAISDWMKAGDVWDGDFNGFPQPSLMVFNLGHDPGYDGYGGLDTGFAGIPLTNDTRPSIGERSWIVKFDIATYGGWLNVR